MKNLVFSLKPIFVSIVFLGLQFNATSRSNPTDNLKDFLITIELTDQGIKLESPEGSAWLTLNFNKRQNQPLLIDEYGMADLETLSGEKNAGLADYLFTIEKTKDGVKLKGIEGTAWKDLAFSLKKNVKQNINQFGMVD